MCCAVMTWDVADHCSSFAESYCLLLHHRRFLKSILKRFSQLYLQLLCGPFFSGSYGGVCKLCTNVSEWPTLTIFKTEELRFYKNDTHSRFFWNVGNHIPNCSALLLRRTQSFLLDSACDGWNNRIASESTFITIILCFPKQQGFWNVPRLSPFFRRVRKIAKSDCLCDSSCAWNNSAPAGRILINLDI